MSDDISIPNPGYRGKRSARYGRAQAGMDPDTKRLLMFAGGLGGVLTCLIVGSSLIGHRSSAVPVVAADTSPLRVRPVNPGGMQIDAAENDVFSGGSDPAAVKLAPVAETPDPNGLNERPKPVAHALAAAPTPAVTAVLPPPETKPAIAAQPHAPARPTVVASAAKPPLTAVPAPAPKAEPEKLPADKVASEKHAEGHAAVQLAALTSEQAARDEWLKMTRRMPELFNGHQPVFTHIDHDGHTFWRVRTTGFTDVAQARTFCEHVKAKGGSCSVADF